MPQKGWQKKMVEKTFECHTQRLTEMKSSVDNKPPRTIGKSKKKEIERRRQYAEIERENKLLLERLAKIMQQKTIDNENHFVRFRRSLTQTHRKLELERITQENQRLLRRIQETEPCYNHLEWEEAAKAREIYLKNMTEFPEMFEKERAAMDRSQSPERLSTADRGGRASSSSLLPPIRNPNKSRPTSTG